MATVKFYVPVDMRNVQTWYGTVVAETSTQIEISNSVDEAIYYGNFSYANNTVSGTLTGYTTFASGTVSSVTTGLSVDATTAATLIQSNQDEALLGLALEGNDTITGSSGGGDYLIGYGGNDTLSDGGGGGATTLDGGTGFNTALFQGPISQYTISYEGNTVAFVKDSVANRDGTVTVLNMQSLQFSDSPYFILDGDGANIARIYSAALGRTADATGLANWINIYDNNVSSPAKSQGVYVALAETSGGFNGSLSIADGFTDSPEFITKYGALSTASFVTQLYANVLGRTPDPTGLAGWLTLMTTGDASGTVYTRSMVLVGFAESNENIAKTSSWLTDMSHSG